MWKLRLAMAKKGKEDADQGDKSIVEIARGLGKKTIAEYVGDEETLALLRDYGVDFAQGFHVGRPVPLEEMVVPRMPEGVAGG